MANKPKENIPEQDEESKIKTTTLNMANDALKQRLDETQVKFPSWKPEVEGAILSGKISDVKSYPFMHQGKGSVMAVIDTGLEGDNARVVFWLNTVAQSQMLKLRNENLAKGQNLVPQEADFEARVEAISELVGEEVIIQYTGEKKSEDKTKKNLNAYQKYTIVRQ